MDVVSLNSFQYVCRCIDDFIAYVASRQIVYRAEVVDVNERKSEHSVFIICVLHGRFNHFIEAFAVCKSSVCIVAFKILKMAFLLFFRSYICNSEYAKVLGIPLYDKVEPCVNAGGEIVRFIRQTGFNSLIEDTEPVNSLGQRFYQRAIIAVTYFKKVMGLFHMLFVGVHNDDIDELSLVIKLRFSND